MIKIKERIGNFLINLLKKNDSQLKFMMGNIFLNRAKKKYVSVKELHETEYKVY